MKKIFVLLVGLMLLVGCATTKPPAPGILGSYYENLQPGPEGAKRWLKPGVDFSKYNKVMVDPISFATADESETKDIDPQQLKELADKCNLALANAIKEKYPVVTEPGPDVLRVRFAIIDLQRSAPVLSGVTSILPVGLVISLIKKGATGSYTGGGTTVGQLLASDSATNDVVAAAQSGYEAGFWERFSSYGSAEDAFKLWGEKVVKFLDESKAAKK